MKKIQTRYPQIDPPTPPVIKHGNGKSTIYFDAGFPIKKNKKTSTSQGFLTSTIQINPATSAHEQLQAAGVLLHLSTHSVGQRQDLMSIGKATQSN
jgi:hypothetical protein